MNKGLAIVEINDAGTRSVFVDQEVIECAKLNARTEKRIARAAKIEKEADKSRRNAHKQTAQRKAYAANTVLHVLLCCLVAGGVVWGGVAGMIHLAIYAPVAAICLCVACLRLGVWIGKRGRYV